MKDAVLCEKLVVIFAEEIQEPIDIETMEGVVRGNKGDMLITGVKGSGKRKSGFKEKRKSRSGFHLISNRRPR